jgi:hypothetical protein
MAEHDRQWGYRTIELFSWRGQERDWLPVAFFPRSMSDQSRRDHERRDQQR